MGTYTADAWHAFEAHEALKQEERNDAPADVFFECYVCSGRGGDCCEGTGQVAVPRHIVEGRKA